MTAHVPMARVPFAPLDNPRLQHLTNVKNRQNGLIAPKTLGGGAFDKQKSTSLFSPPSQSTATKRAFDSSAFDELDCENVDPAVFDSPSKKTKTFTFSLTSAKTMPPPAPRLSTPVRANISSPRAPLTAPAGRSPTRKTHGISKTRRVSAPFSRIDPPFGSRVSKVPFSLDAALSGTFASSSSSSSAAQSAGATIQESMPKTWFFDIYEDTPEEEAGNLMEHSTLTLDLSSDEESNKRERDSRGKENVPPEGYDAPAASRPLLSATSSSSSSSGAPLAVKKTDVVRRKLLADEMDDGQRSPLSDLETEPFFPEGCDKESHVVVVDGVDGKNVHVEQVAIPAAVQTSPSEPKTPETMVAAAPVAAVESEAKEAFVVWEDVPAKESAEIAVVA